MARDRGCRGRLVLCSCDRGASSCRGGVARGSRRGASGGAGRRLHRACRGSRPTPREQPCGHRRRIPGGSGCQEDTRPRVRQRDARHWPELVADFATGRSLSGNRSRQRSGGGLCACIATCRSRDQPRGSRRGLALAGTDNRFSLRRSRQGGSPVSLGVALGARGVGAIDRPVARRPRTRSAWWCWC